jgi:hypothetical protein
MNRYVIFSVGLLMLGLSACAGGPGPMVHKIPEYSRGSVAAVWNLEDVSIKTNTSLQNMADFLTAKVSETLKDKGGYVMIERQKMLLALEELSLGSSSLADETARLEVGKILGAQLMVFGAYQQLGEQFRIDLRMIAVESGAVIRTSEKTVHAANAAGWLKAAEEAAAGIL